MVTLFLHTSAIHLAHWIEEYTRNASYGPPILTDEGRVVLQSVHAPVDIARPVTLEMSAFVVSQHPEKSGAELAIPIERAITFRLIPLSESRVELRIGFFDEVLEPYVARLLGEIDARWPQADKQSVPQSPLRSVEEATMEQFQYEVALSFAGEQREYVRRVAEELKRRDVSVFFDEYETAVLWGKNLVDHLDEVYRKSARYCVVFVSREYAAKAWPNVERRSAQAKAITKKGEYILPVRFDETELPGLVPTVSYLSADRYTPEQIAAMFVEKLGGKIDTRAMVLPEGTPGIRAVDVPSSTLALASKLMGLLAGAGFQWKPQRGDIIWCSSILTGGGYSSWDLRHRIRHTLSTLQEGRIRSTIRAYDGFHDSSTCSTGRNALQVINCTS